MTEVIESTAISATILARHLGESGFTALIPYLGVQTAQAFDAAVAQSGAESGSETDALLSGAAVHDLGWLRRTAVIGEDRYRWLSGMVTNRVETLPENTGAYNLVLNAQGRIQGDLTVWRAGGELDFVTTAQQQEALLTHFDRFIVMDDVELVSDKDESALGLTGPKAEEIVAALGLPALAGIFTGVDATATHEAYGESIPLVVRRSYGTIVAHYELWVENARLPALWEMLKLAGAIPVGADAVESLRIAEGIPTYGVDIQSRDLAQETAQTQALDFTKGCYLGQEIVERIRSRGQVHRHLRALEVVPGEHSATPTPGTELLLSDSGPDAKPVGVLTSVTTLQLNGAMRVFAIGMIRAEAEVGNRLLTYPGGRAHVLPTPPPLEP